MLTSKFDQSIAAKAFRFKFKIKRPANRKLVFTRPVFELKRI